jgi:hypothetical protein
LKGLKNGWWFMLAAFLLALSFYSYHSPRLVAPLIAIGWAWYYREKIIPKYKLVLLSIAAFLIILIPFFHEFLVSGSARFASVTVLNPVGRTDQSIKRIDEEGHTLLSKVIHNRRVVYIIAIAKGYLDLFLTGDNPDRHHAVDMGMLYLWEAPFILMGIIMLLKKKGSFPIFWWFLVAPTASAITSGTPHAVRALLFLPTYQVFTGVGLMGAQSWLRKQPWKHLVKQAVAVVVLGFIFINVFYYFQMYYVHSPIEVSQSWQYGYKQAVALVKQHENEVDKIVITYKYDQPYIYVLFYGKVDPAWYQAQWGGGEILRAQRNFGKYEFRDIDWRQDQYAKNTIFVGTPREIPDVTPTQLGRIFFLDGTIALTVIKR